MTSMIDDLRSLPAPIPGHMWTSKPCPECGNRNRHERRKCKALGRGCRGSGFLMVMVRIPLGEPTIVKIETADGAWEEVPGVVSVEMAGTPGEGEGR